jgi:hypothetical protein
MATGQWPSGLSEVVADTSDTTPIPAPAGTNHPRGTAGAAQGDGCWFVTQGDRLRRFSLDGSPGCSAPDEVGLPEAGIDQLGDCDVAGDRLYVAMEGTVPARIGVFDLDLDFRGSAPVTAQSGSCTWCAIDPRQGRLYSSPHATAHLCVYQLIGGGGSLGLRHRRDVALWTDDGTRLHLDQVRGGTFTDDGHPGLLLLTTDGRDGAVHGIDVRSGRRFLHHPLDPGPDVPDGHDHGLVGGITATKETLHVLVRDPATGESRFRHFALDG